MPGAGSGSERWVAVKRVAVIVYPAAGSYPRRRPTPATAAGVQLRRGSERIGKVIGGFAAQRVGAGHLLSHSVNLAAAGIPRRAARFRRLLACPPASGSLLRCSAGVTPTLVLVIFANSIGRVWTLTRRRTQHVNHVCASRERQNRPNDNDVKCNYSPYHFRSPTDQLIRRGLQPARQWRGSVKRQRARRRP